MVTYNLEVDPSARGRRHAARLIFEAFEQAAREGCVQGVANCRAPSFAGSSGFAQERVRANPRFRRAVESALRTGRLPTARELALDPTLALYQRLSGCRFVGILRDFAPADTASGGMRFLAFGTRRDWDARCGRGTDAAPVVRSAAGADT